jgi:hypothetical protein
MLAVAIEIAMNQWGLTPDYIFDNMTEEQLGIYTCALVERLEKQSGGKENDGSAARGFGPGSKPSTQTKDSTFFAMVPGINYSKKAAEKSVASSVSIPVSKAK